MSKQTILNVFTDAMSNILYYDRKEDSGLGVGDIEKAIREGVVSESEIVALVAGELNRSVKASGSDEVD